MAGHGRESDEAWRHQGGFAARIDSPRQLQTFNDLGSFAVDFDVLRSVTPAIRITGNKNRNLCVWETRSASGFVTTPRIRSGYITVRFITNGHITYRHRASDARGTPTHATLVGFEDLSEVRASQAFSAINGTIAVDILAEAHAALTGEPAGLPALATVADVDTPGLKALFCTMKQVQRRVPAGEPGSDLVLPLIQEIISYQLLSVWPRLSDPGVAPAVDAAGSSLRIALDYIEANLSAPLVLADIAAAAGISVRSLQDKFRRTIGRTPFQFIIDQRLTRAHRDLLGTRAEEISVAEIARRWGFVHMSDFGQRYKRMYGLTPSACRRDA